MAYYYGTTHQNVINCVDWKTLRDFFGSSLIDRTCAYYSTIAEDIVTLTSLGKTRTPQQKMQCVLWLTEFDLNSINQNTHCITRVQRRVRTEWNVVSGLPNRLIRTPTKRITHTINSVFYHENLRIFTN
ncbi:uncharacterized protein TNCV_1409491 [Trichonephila clavipes]|uniref:Uncharacterized protein n=1 Tax=Trichonephila clavipes TaxID=2585209 RepID=A0A8X6R6J4_TRICX|nr:uncharacterized protein TNCV_1409491 [Trichonephila clavipes]